MQDRLPLGVATKRCSCCGATKPITEFHRAESKPDGRQPWCRECNVAQAKAAHANDPEYCRARIKE
ncbi:MAG: hypothetical protein JWP02_3282, partial [Acidimicrobiales bacterium]|nr:hypothetical protein [Acidimicrobiales bacterium]